MTVEHNSKNLTLLLIIAGLVLVVGLILLLARTYSINQPDDIYDGLLPLPNNGATNPDLGSPLPVDEGEMVFCTMDAKLCPDGSYVGRVAPDCAFAPCPGDGDSGVGSALPGPSIAEQVAACLPLSDLGSKETCERLLASIQDYQACEQAGFPILESYPSQCVLPDGRVFIGF